MGCDMVVALSKATVQASTLFGLNHIGVSRSRPTLLRIAGADHAPDERLERGSARLPQVRRTHAVLGLQPARAWGLTHGINEHRLAAGCCRWRSKLATAEHGLTATDLVRLVLERSQSARQAHDVLADLLCRHGQKLAEDQETGDGIFLLADPAEAFVIESAGNHWASLECQHVRAISDTGLIRQDWRRLSPGLGEFAIAQGWWPDDGSKLDLAGSLAAPSGQAPGALKRWGHATRQLEQQDGNIDSQFLRRLLSGQLEPEVREAGASLISCFLAVLPAEQHSLPIAWCSLGPAAMPLFVPIFLEGEWTPDEAFAKTLAHFDDLLDSPKNAAKAKAALDRLQGRIDQQTDEFIEEARVLQAQGNGSQVARLAGLLMQTHAELIEAEIAPPPVRQDRRAPHFAGPMGRPADQGAPLAVAAPEVRPYPSDSSWEQEPFG